MNDTIKRSESCSVFKARRIFNLGKVASVAIPLSALLSACLGTNVNSPTTASTKACPEKFIGKDVNICKPTASLVTAPKIIPQETCVEVVVNTVNKDNDVLPTPTAINYSLNVSGINGGFYSDPVCNLPVTSATLPANSDTLKVWFKGTSIGNGTISISGGGLTPGVYAFASDAKDPRFSLALSSGGTQVPQGGCSLVAVGILDNQNAPYNAVYDITAQISSTMGAFYKDSACKTVATTATISAKSQTTGVYFKSITFGDTQFTAKKDGFQTANLPVSVLINTTGVLGLSSVSTQAGQSIASVTGPTSIAVGQCAPYMISSQNIYGDPLPVSPALNINLESSSIGGKFYSDSACTVQITSVLMASGSSSVGVFYEDAQIGEPTLKAKATTYQDATIGVAVRADNVTIIPLPSPTGSPTPAPSASAGIPSAFAITGNTPVTAGTCNAETLLVKDAGGATVNLTADTIVNLSTDLGVLYADSACATPVNGVALQAGSSSKLIYFRSTATGLARLVASNTAFQSGRLTVAVIPGAPSRIGMSGATFTLAGTCIPQIVAIQDVYGNNSPVSAVTPLGLSASIGGFYSDSSCNNVISTTNIAASGSTATVYFRGTVAGTSGLIASNPAYANANQSVLISSLSPTVLVLTLASPALVNSCIPGNVQSQDKYGNPSNVLQATPVTLSPASGKFYSDSNCTSMISSTAIATGSNTQPLYYSSQASGKLTVMASSPGYTSGSAVVTINSGPPSVFVLTGSSPVVAGTCNAETVTMRDASGNNAISGSAVTALLASTISTGSTALGGFYANSTCTTPAVSVDIPVGSSSATVYFQSNAIGTASQVASQTGFTSGTLSVKVNAAAPVALLLNGPSTGSVGACLANVFSTQDTFGNTAPVQSATPIALTPASGFYSDSQCMNPITTVTIPANASSVTAYYRGLTAGLVSLTGKNGAYPTINWTLTLSAGSPSVLVLTLTPTTIAAGTCLQGTVTTQDSYGNLSSVTNALQVSLNITSGSANSGFYTDMSCTTNATTATVPAAGNTQAVFFKGTKIGAVAVNAAASGFSASFRTLTIKAGSPSVIFLTGNSPVSAGNCSNETVSLKDDFGNNSSVTASTVFDLNTNIGTFYSDSACSVSKAISTVTFPTNSSSQNIFFKSSAIGTANQSASLSGLTPATLPVVVNAGTPSLLKLSGPAFAIAGTCILETLSTHDANGNTSPVSSNSTFGLTSIGAGTSNGFGTFYSDSSCQHTVTSISIPAGSSSSTFYFSSQRPGTANLSATYTGYTPANQSLVVNASTPSALVLAVNSSSIVANTCLIGDVTTQDVYGNTSNVAATTTVSLNSTIGSLYDSSSCSNAVTSVAIAAGSATKPVYFRSTLAGSAVLTASSSGLTPSSQNVAVTAAAPTVLSLKGNSPIGPSVCSAQILSTLDIYGNNSNVSSSTPVNLTTDLGTFYLDQSCSISASSATIGANSNSIPLYFRSVVGGSANQKAIQSGFTTGNLNVIVNNTIPTAVVLAMSNTVVNAGVCLPGTISFKDSNSNFTIPSSALSVELATVLGSETSGSKISFFSDSNCANRVTSVNVTGGTSTQPVYFKSQISGAANLTASSAGLSSSNQSVTVNAAPASALTLAMSHNAIIAGGCLSGTISTQDSFGNSSSVGSNLIVTLSSLANNAAIGNFYSDSNCTSQTSTATISSGTSSHSIYFRSTKIGTPTLTAASGLSPSSQNITVFASAPYMMVLAMSANPAAVGACLPGNIYLEDIFGNYVTSNSALTMNLSWTSGTSTQGGFYNSSNCSNAVTSITLPAGQSSQAVYFQSPASALYTLVVASPGLNSGTQSLTLNAGSPSVLVLAVNPSSFTTGTCVAGTVSVQDSFGNATPLSSVLQVSLTESLGAFYNSSSCSSAISSVTIPVNSNTQTVYFKSPSSGVSNVSATSSGYVTSTRVLTISSSGPSIIALSGAPTVNVGTCNLETIALKDAFGNAATFTTDSVLNLTPGKGSFYSDSSCNSAIASIAFPAGTNAKNVYFQSSVIGVANQIAEKSGLTSGSFNVTVNPGAASALVWSGTGFTVVGGCVLQTVTTIDSFGNVSAVSSNTAVNVNTDLGTLYFDSSCTHSVPLVGGVGTITVPASSSSVPLYYRSILLGNATLTASRSGFASGTQAITVGTAAPTVLVLAMSSNTVGTGTCLAGTVSTQDAFGNPSSVLSNTSINLSATLGGFYSDSSCSSLVSATTMGSGSSSQTVYFRSNAGGNAVLTASSTGYSSSSQSVLVNNASPSMLSLSGASPVTAGVCGPEVISVKDQYGNNANVTSNTTVAMTTSIGVFYSDSSCSSSITSAIIAAGSSTKTVYYRSIFAGTANQQVSTSGLASANLSVVVNAAAATRMGMSGASIMTAGSCNAVVLSTYDPYGNLSSVTTNTAITLGASSGAVYSDSSCNSAMSGFNLPAGINNYGIYFKGTIAGAVTISAASSGLGSASLPVTLKAGPISALTSVVTVSPAVVALGSGQTGTLTITGKDSFGNFVTTGGATVVMNLTVPSIGTLGVITDQQNGTYTGIVTPVAAGTTSFSGMINGVAIATAMPTFKVNGLSFSHAIEMIDSPVYLTNALSCINAWETSRTNLDTSAYDGQVSYSFEVVASSGCGTNIPINLIDSSNQVVATINIARQTSKMPTRYTIPFNPVGSNNYRIQLSRFSDDTRIVVYTARIIVNQVGASKTKLYIPLMSNYFDGIIGGSTYLGVDSTYHSYYDQGNSDHYRIWNKTLSNYATLASSNPWQLDAVLWSNSPHRTCNASLVKAGTTTSVTGSDMLSTSNVLPTLVSKQFGESSSFPDLNNFELKLRTSQGDSACMIAKAGLWISLNPLAKGEAHFRFEKGLNGKNTNQDSNWLLDLFGLGSCDNNGSNYATTASRMLMNFSGFSSSNLKMFYEITGRTTDQNNDNIQVLQIGATSDDYSLPATFTLGGCTITGTQLGPTRARYRSAACTGMVNGDRYFSVQHQEHESGVLSSGSYAIIQF